MLRRRRWFVARLYVFAWNSDFYIWLLLWNGYTLLNVISLRTLSDKRRERVKHHLRSGFATLYEHSRILLHTKPSITLHTFPDNNKTTGQ